MIICNSSNQAKSSKFSSNLYNFAPKRVKSEMPSRLKNQRYSGSYLSDHQKNCIKLFKTFEKLCVTYNNIPKIEIEKAKKSLSKCDDLRQIELEQAKKNQEKSTKYEKTRVKVNDEPEEDLNKRIKTEQ